MEALATVSAADSSRTWTRLHIGSERSHAKAIPRFDTRRSVDPARTPRSGAGGLTRKDSAARNPKSHECPEPVHLHQCHMLVRDGVSHVSGPRSRPLQDSSH